MNKLELIEKHRLLLQLVYYLGNGVMFVTQLAQFMNKHKTQLWRDINELIDGGLIEKIPFHRHSILKVKAYAIRIFKKKDRVNSIAVTSYKIQKSAFICEVILQNFAFRCNNAEEYLSTAMNHTNFVNSDDTDLGILNSLNEGMHARAMQTQKLTEAIKSGNYLELGNYRKHLNIYIEKCIGRESEKKLIVCLAILDLSSINPKQMAERIAKVYFYCDDILQNNLPIEDCFQTHYNFTFYVSDENRHKYVLKQIDQIKTHLQNMNIIPTAISIEAYNLNITSSLFSNQIIFR